MPKTTRSLLLLTLPAITFLLAACAGPGPREDFSHEGLEMASVRGLDEVWIRPGTDFGGYRSIMIEPVEVAFDPHWDPRRSGSHLRLGTAERERIRSEAAELFDTTFERELERSERFTVVDTAGADTLIFRPRIVDLHINAPEDRMATARTRTYVSEFGRVSLIGELRDAESGAIVARIADREVARAAGNFEFTDRLANEREGQRIFSRWARTLADGLDRLSESQR